MGREFQIYKRVRRLDALDVVRTDGEQQRVTHFILKRSGALGLDIETTFMMKEIQTKERNVPMTIQP